MLARIETIPRTSIEWVQWAFDHRDSHDRIRAKVLSVKNVSLPDPPIYPIDPNDLSEFLLDNATIHTAMNGALGLQSRDLQDVDTSDQTAMAEWFQEHYQEHFDAEGAIGA
jgi:hypothetical protein